jgi:type II secretory pathway pseudopilin PulG
MNKFKIKLKKFAEKRGSGMIEILISTGVVGIVMTAVVAGFVLSVKSTEVGKNKVFASTRAQEAMEAFRREKVLLGWTQFADSINATDTYCVNDLPSDSTEFGAMQAGQCGEDEVITDTIFNRTALVDFSPDTINPVTIRVEIIVDWAENNVPVSLVQEFKQYD